MAADHTGDNGAQEKPATPYLRLKARESLGDDPKGTNSWSILKQMKISLVDGGVSILKQGISKLTGAFSGRDLPMAGDLAPTPVNSGTQSDGVIQARGTVDSGRHVDEETVPSRVGDAASEEDTAAFGFDWVDNLLEELDASHPLPSDNNPSVTANVDRHSSDELLFPGV
jgi:hypothetical protein